MRCAEPHFFTYTSEKEISHTGSCGKSRKGVHLEKRITGNGLTSTDGPLTKGKAMVADAPRPACAVECCIKDGQQGSERFPSSPKTTSESCLAMTRQPIMVPLPSHRHKQWGQLGEILGGVRYPEGGASRRSVCRHGSGSSVE